MHSNNNECLDALSHDACNETFCDSVCTII